MSEPATAVPLRKPLTAADLPGWRSPPIAMIIGKTGPDANPPIANRAIDTGSDGTKIAPATAMDITAAETVANPTWANLSASCDETSRPTASPAQNSESAVVAVLSGAGSGKRTSQFDTPTTEPT